MAKKRFISSFLLCAFAIIFAHSIVPHHHHEEKSTMEQGTHDDHHHDNDHDEIDDNFLGEAFSHFQHESGSTIIYETASSVDYSKITIDKGTAILTLYIIRQLYKPPIIYFEHRSTIFISSHFSDSSLFRGPPAA